MSEPIKVLIVDDEDIFADNVRDYLERRGWCALVARTGCAAVAARREFAPGLILLDYHLPDMDGFQALCAMAPGECRNCILMTAHPPETVAARAEQLGIDRILYKPFSFSEMETELLAASDH